MQESKLFTPYNLGPIKLRNKTIRAAAFEGMCAGNVPTELLYDYHTAVAAGGIGMTTVAYASVTRNGLSFPHQLWMRKEIVPALRRLMDAVHREGAAVSIQLGHCGNMSKRKIAGETPVSASSGFNIYAPTFVRKMRKNEIYDMAKAFGSAVKLSREAGFDAVEIHAGHGYLISQFLSKFTNHRRDEYGGSLENRMRFMNMVMLEALEAGGGKIAVTAKINTSKDFAKAFHYEMADFNVGVTALCPGAVNTSLYKLDARKRDIALKYGIMMPTDKLADMGIRTMFRKKTLFISGRINRIALPLLHITPMRFIQYLKHRTRILDK